MATSHKRRVQFKSSYLNHNVTLVPCGDLSGLIEDTPQVVVPQQKSDYISRNTYLEGNVSFNATYERLAVSFTPADEYNSSGAVIGTHPYDGILPAWYEVGTELRINGEAMVITDIVTESSVTYAITSSTTNAPEIGAIIESLHLSLPYEVWEFDVDAANVPHTQFYIKVEATLDGVVKKTYISEPVNVITDDEFSAGNYHRCLFFGSGSDGEVDYSFGIIHQRVIPYWAAMMPLTETEIDSQKLDNRIVKIDYEGIALMEMRPKAMPAMVAHGICRMFNETINSEVDGMYCTTMNDAKTENKGQFYTPNIQLAVSGMANEFNNQNSTQGYAKGSGFTEFYPVVVG